MAKALTKKPIKTVKKTVSKAVSKKVDVKYVALERLDSKGLDAEGIRVAIRDTLRFNNYFSTYKDGYEWLLTYVKATRSPDQFKSFKKAEDWQATITVCTLAKMANAGFQLDEKSKNFLEKAVDNMIRIGNSKETAVEVQKPKTENPVPQEVAYDIETAFDNWPAPIDVRQVIGSRTLTKTELANIASYWENVLSSVKEDFKDKEAKSGYWFLKTAADFKAYVARIEKLIVDLTQNAPVKVRAPRKPRTVKAKSAEQVASKVRFQAMSQTYNVTSLPPASIVGAKAVLLFNVKLRTLTYLKTDNEKGFSFTGTTVTNIDEKTSFKKTLRKPVDVLPNLKGVAKARVEKVFGEIKTTAQEANGRMTTDTVILRVF